MSDSKLGLIKGGVIAVVATGALLATTASAATYVVCNRWNECWRVHEHYNSYPADTQIVYHDDAWYTEHEHDAHWRWLKDPDDDHGWYDADGVWHRFETRDEQRP